MQMGSSQRENRILQTMYLCYVKDRVVDAMSCGFGQTDFNKKEKRDNMTILDSTQ